MMKFFTYILTLMVSVLTGCSEAGLHDKYEEAFLIGVAVGSEDIGHPYKFPMKKNAKEWRIIHKEFNSLTAENLMKMQYMHPSRIFIILMMQMNLLKKQNGMATLSLGIRWSGMRWHRNGYSKIDQAKQFLRKSCISG